VSENEKELQQRLKQVVLTVEKEKSAKSIELVEL